LSEFGKYQESDSQTEVPVSLAETENEVELIQINDVIEDNSNELENLLVRFAAADVSSLGDEENYGIQYLEDIEDDAADLAEQLAFDEVAAETEMIDSELSTLGAVELLDMSNRVIEDLSIEECINRSFLLKQSGDYEGAIISLMKVLEMEPDNQLVFMIVLDICSMYKSLGQTEFAKGILEGYLEDFGDQMDIAIKSEIQKIYSYI
ncbi:MAG: hypothetical protein K0R31_1994, partial [Clostridiales bacterium]|nr:hypothetical protein [Clostridiales bacterium]